VYKLRYPNLRCSNRGVQNEVSKLGSFVDFLVAMLLMAPLLEKIEVTGIKVRKMLGGRCD
jgi:hypothetical protein